jgi:4-alpha-glucanotransferase
MEYLNVNNVDDLIDATIRMGYATSSNAAIYQVQDILKLDNSARMNEPSTVGKNWKWRMLPGQLHQGHIDMLAMYAGVYGRGRAVEEDEDVEE